MFEVVLSPSAAGFYAAADKPLAIKLAKCFRRLEMSPREGGNVKRLAGELRGYMRYRVGDWRVIYRIDDRAATVTVATIGHRRDVYE